MKYEIRNMSGDVIYVAEIDCDADAPPGVRLGHAVKVAVRDGANLARANLTHANLTGANLTHANLTGANLARADLAGANLARAYLAGANLRHANLARANLQGADLTHAILHGANLAGANLAGANLHGANLTHAILHGANLTDADLTRANLTDADFADADLTRVNGIIDGGQRSDGFRLVAVRNDNGPRIAAGCRWFTLAEARKHWTQTRGGTPLGDETLARLDMLERAARAHGWPMGDEIQEVA